jgi:hypothetical protein
MNPENNFIKAVVSFVNENVIEKNTKILKYN